MLCRLLGHKFVLARVCKEDTKVPGNSNRIVDTYVCSRCLAREELIREVAYDVAPERSIIK